jgi:hypothetical protein
MLVDHDDRIGHDAEQIGQSERRGTDWSHSKAMVSVVGSTRPLISRFTDPAQILFIQQAGSLAQGTS